ncbi:MAG TPA: phosphatidylglycerophosphatase A [Pseudomonadota bacterium]|nr:phosphatidylglycerophosphatase A [Pseudomonadota bacterium]HNF99313.1 phosphatidylglycerophosphatase A [Pseudomonadota bacterium]HNI58682.1 phosphatidylglycerophosphatase A [Pseudomonadota bacterium]HNK47188.1 phosphatidylglycerophosphatase A [Pseudomonadota bacterium]HNO69132.1 phosphatidylglycerophosphatase A [Pseudomonadota bacterium]
MTATEAGRTDEAVQMSAKWSRRERIAIQIATVFRIGEVAPWPGHYATLFTVPFAIALHKTGPWPHAIATLLLFAIGTWAAEEYSRLTGKHDHRSIVIDEVVGYLVTVWLAPWHFLSFFLGYFLFRVLDGLKPGPLRLLDRHVKGGFGVMLDDVAAGAVGALILHWLVPWTAPTFDAMLQKLW